VLAIWKTKELIIGSTCLELSIREELKIEERKGTEIEELSRYIFRNLRRPRIKVRVV